MSHSFENFDRGIVDLESLNEFLGQFEGVRKHLLQAGRELTLAMKALVDSLLESLEREYPGGRQKWEFLYVLQYGLGFLQGRVFLSEEDIQTDREKSQYKISVLESILAVIQSEIDQMEKAEKSSESASASEKEQIKVGAMRAIAKVLTREIQRARHDSKAKPGPNPPKKGKSKKPSPSSEAFRET